MSSRSKLARFLSLPPSERLLLIKSALTLAAVKGGLRLLPFTSLEKLLGRATRISHRFRNWNSEKPDLLIRMVDIAGRHVPGTGSCLTRALAAQLLLARRGHRSTVRIGVARGGGQQLKAHAWLESEGRVLIGDSELECYAPLLAIERGVP